MRLYLVQHGEAKREEDDSARPLSAKGLQDITKVASYLSKLDVRADSILHSTKLRARQTAEVLYEYLKPLKGLLEKDGLAPLDDPEIWKERVRDSAENLFLVGHLPHLNRLSSLLLCGDTERSVIAFQMAGVVCLERDDKGTWSVKWMIAPDIVVGETAGSCDTI
ncbi:MAG: phosphohistidine phosphatase SixA [Nitrospirota bacterium]